MAKVTNVSFEGSAEDKRRIALLANLMNKSVGWLVRRAVYQVYGDLLNRIDEINANFFSDPITRKQYGLPERNEGDS